MKLSRPTRHLFISLGIIALWGVLLYALFYPSTTGLGKGFNLAILYMFTQYVALAAGCILLVHRILFQKKIPFLYMLTGTLNGVVGLSCVFLFAIGEANLPWLHECLLNLLLGFLMISDLFFILPKA